jgi:DNA-binding NarL/FixJ family response regulator
MSLPKILLVEDHAILAQGIVKGIAAEFSVTVAANLAAARSCLAAEKFLLVLMDLTLQDGENSFDLIAEVRRLETPVIIFSGTATDANLRTAIALDVSGFFDKSDGMETLVGAINAVKSGRTSFPMGLLAKLLAEGTKIPYLSDKQESVLSMMMRNPAMKPTLIAPKICLSIGRTRNLIAQLKKKFNVVENCELIAEASRRGFYPKPHGNQDLGNVNLS